MEKTLLTQLTAIQRLKELAPVLSPETLANLQDDELRLVEQINETTGMDLFAIYASLKESMDKPSAEERSVSLVSKLAPYVPSILKLLWGFMVKQWPALATGAVGAVVSYLITTYCS